MTTLILVRHGETVDNVNHIMQGQTQGQLTAQGLLQAHRLAESLRSEPIDVFVSSDLKRSVDTCRVVAEGHGKDVVTTPLLRERDWGSFTGRYIPSLKGETWPDDIESLEAHGQLSGLDGACRWPRNNQQSHSGRLLRQADE